MGRQHYSKRHYERLSNGGPDAPGAAAERIRHRHALDRAAREAAERFAVLPPGGPIEVAEWIKARVDELKRTQP